MVELNVLSTVPGAVIMVLRRLFYNGLKSLKPEIEVDGITALSDT